MTAARPGSGHTIGSWAEGTLTMLPRTTAEERRRAARRVATAAASATDAAELLAALGLTAEDGLRPAEGISGPDTTWASIHALPERTS